MDGAIVVVAVDQPLTTKPQLLQHLAAIDVGNIKKVIICMNKIDLVEKEVLIKRKLELDLLLKNYNITPYAIIPTSFNKNIGVNHVINCIMEQFDPTNLSLLEKESPELNICRTFDPNKPGGIGPGIGLCPEKFLDLKNN
jgi:translation initiation factor 2 subunit 3